MITDKLNEMFAEKVYKEQWFVKESMLKPLQLDILNSKEDNMLVTGDAGTGKTVLAIHRLIRIIESGDSILFVIYTKVLKDYIYSAANYIFDEIGSNVDIKYAEELKEDYENDIKYTYDYVIIDEVQDLGEEILKYLKEHVEKGIIAYGDEKQQLYETYGGLKICKIEEIIYDDNNFKKINLLENYRVPRSIIDFISNIMDNNLYETAQNELGKKPIIKKFETEKEEVSWILEYIEKKHLEDVGILLSENTNVALFKEKATSLRPKTTIQYKLKEKINGREKSINEIKFKTKLPKCTTYHSSKGTEFRNVFLPFCNLVKNFNGQDQWKRAFYVAATRVKEQLIITYNNEKTVGTDVLDIINAYEEG